MTTPFKPLLGKALPSHVAEKARFLLTGISNVMVDIGVFNVLFYIGGNSLFSHTFILYKTISFLVAATWSYVINHYFVFGFGKKNVEYVGHRKTYSTFMAITISTGLLLIGISSVLFTLFSCALANIAGAYSAQVNANIAQVIASGVVALLNYFSYKYIVFK